MGVVVALWRLAALLALVIVPVDEVLLNVPLDSRGRSMLIASCNSSIASRIPRTENLSTFLKLMAHCKLDIKWLIFLRFRN